MDREWTYRPPLLVGERVVWLGGAAGLGESESCDYGPHHGTVSWIGRVPDMGTSWTVGADFETAMNGGCDGAWKGRHIFSCKPGHGLFLPVTSLIKEEEFYGRKQSTSSVTQSQTRTTVVPMTTAVMPEKLNKSQAALDISLAPEPPPPRLRGQISPSYDIHARNYLKHGGVEGDASVYYALGGNNPSERRQPRSNIQDSKDKGSSSFSTSVITSSVSSSSATTTSTTIYTSSVCSSTSYTTTLKVEEPDLGQMNTLNINRLLRRLEAAISCGNHAEAAKLAHELAELRISCSVTRTPKNKVNIDSQSFKSTNWETAPDEKASGKAKSEGELPRPFTPISSMSECFYDAFEKLDNEDINEEDDTSLEADDAVSINYMAEPYSFLNSSNTEAMSSKTSSNLPPPSQLQTSLSAHALSNSQETTSIHEEYLDDRNERHASKGCIAVPNMRETRVDPARREVKSDTISKLPNEPKANEKDVRGLDSPFNVKMYVEDKNSHQGPITFSVVASMTVGELREKVCQDFGFPPEVQRWILGRRLADDDHLTLGHHKVAVEGCPIFLYLVAPEPEPQIRIEKPLEEFSLANNNSSQNSSYASVAGYNHEGQTVHEAKNSAVQKFYNPDTHSYEVSEDVDYGDINGDNTGCDENNILQNNDNCLYQNIASSDGRNQEYTQAVYSTSQMDKFAIARKDKMDVQPQVQKIANSIPQQQEHPANSSSFVSPVVVSLSAVAAPNTVLYEPIRPLDNCVFTVSPSTDYKQNINGSTSQQSEPVYPPTHLHKPLNRQPSLEDADDQQHRENDTSERVPLNKLQVTPELQKQKKLIQELQHQHHYAQVHHTKQLPPEYFSLGSHQSLQPLPQTSTTPDIQGTQVHQQTVPDSILRQDEEHQPMPNNVKEQMKHLGVQNLSSNHENNQVQPKQSFQESLDDRELLSQKNGENSSNHKQMSPPSSPASQEKQPQMQQEEKSYLLHPQQQPPNQKNSLSSQPLQEQKLPQAKQCSQFVNHAPQMSSSKPDNTVTETPIKEEGTLPSPTKGHGWVCPSCTFVNKWERPGCEVCATERPGTQHFGKNTENADKDTGIGAAISVLERQGCVPNQEPFECRICFLDIGIGEGAVLRDCLHTFCKDCLSNAIRYSDTAEVKCPYRDNQYSCDFSLQDREIKALLNPQEFEKHLNKSVKQAEGAMQNVFHCKTPDCPGFCQYEDNVNLFHCDVCERVNCLTCQALHEGKTCQEYQDDLAQKVDEAAMKTKKFFDDMIRRGDGLPCPKCSVMLVRKWGCDWMRCPMCRTEICWVTRGPRWGPGGAGDVSGGCKCGIRGQKCHPKCTYCH